MIFPRKSKDSHVANSTLLRQKAGQQETHKQQYLRLLSIVEQRKKS